MGRNGVGDPREGRDARPVALLSTRSTFGWTTRDPLLLSRPSTRKNLKMGDPHGGAPVGLGSRMKSYPVMASRYVPERITALQAAGERFGMHRPNS